MIGKNLDQITEADLQALKDNKVVEGKTIEYKQSLPGQRDGEKVEFLANVSSFANASGGDLIFGIVEDRNTGIPEQIEGLTVENVDQEISRLDGMIRAGIQPRILGIYFKPVVLSNSKTALVVRIPRSWISPHRVIYQGHDKFYSRSANGKYPLDVGELRIAFNLSETTTERIRRFREERISKIVANETPVPFYESAKIVLHLIPIISFSPAQSYEITRIASHPDKMQPIYCREWNHRHNFDGFLTYCEDVNRGRISYSYVQLFRNGIIEAVEGLLLEPDGRMLSIPSIAYEQALIESVPRYLSILESLNVELPVFVFLTLLGVKGYSMGVRYLRSDEGHTIGRDVLLLPETIIENYKVSASDVLRPLFDSIWNACGFSRSRNYDEAGNWVG